jgi:hypothetical protein
MIAPGAGPQKVRRDTLGRGDSIAYPAGWVHYQLNDGCSNATALLVWNAVHSGGVNNVAQQLGALPDEGEGDYKGALFPRGKGPRQGFWLRDAECARRCGLETEAGGGEVASAAEAEASSGGGRGRRAMDAALAA